MATYLVPEDSRGLINDDRVGKCVNLSLLLGRYVPQEAITNNLNWRPNDKGDKRKYRDGWLQEVVCQQFDLGRNSAWQTLLKAQYARWQQRTQGAARFTARSLGRLIVGLGGKGPMEFGLTVQHVCGLPIIPGSALKGLTRAYALLTIAAQFNISLLNSKELNEGKLSSHLDLLDAALAGVKEDREKMWGELLHAVSKLDRKGLEDDPAARAYAEVFGSQDAAGTCVFFDAVIAGVEGLPKQGKLFKVDVMTPHFNSYYQGNGAPHDAEYPVPVPFLTVTHGVTFAFAVAARKGHTPPLDTVTGWLQAALNELGIGAKTAAGYGVFNVLPK
ncbi:MAG TPA: type III-B CRISPR module RAMP protein Cmr6 [Aggregatilineales bacterium]|nr:type III-B CRISPR module RAMP protein Cmr6 [Anaerolineales bacterium]HRE46692.1 type III-B CRISPR module RAMP protein Cmr6 [Aggregatilineales bacterium]